MPFKLPEYDSAFAQLIHDVVYDLARSRSPLLGQIRIEPSVGTASTVVDSRDADRLDFPEHSIGFGMTLDADAVRASDFAALVVELDAASEELGRGLVGMLFEHVGKITESTGNVVKVDGELTFEHFYEALDGLEWSLTDDDELSLPQLVMHPDMVKKLPSAWTAEQEAALEDLKRRKHEELLARRRHRRLS